MCYVYIRFYLLLLLLLCRRGKAVFVIALTFCHLLIDSPVTRQKGWHGNNQRATKTMTSGETWVVSIGRLCRIKRPCPFNSWPLSCNCHKMRATNFPCMRPAPLVRTCAIKRVGLWKVLGQQGTEGTCHCHSSVEVSVGKIN